MTKEERVIEVLPLHFVGITYLMEKTSMPYYVILSILTDLERQGVAEKSQIGMVNKWRRVIQGNNQETSPQSVSMGNLPTLEEVSIPA